MSFGFSIGDFVLLSQLAWTVVQRARAACGSHDELTREVQSLHVVLKRIEAEVSKPESIIHSSDTDGKDDRKEELAGIVEHCRHVLRVLDGILQKYNELSAEKRTVTRLWKTVRFGNGEAQDLSQLRLELATHTSALTLFLNLLALGSQGKVEQHMLSHGEGLRAVRHSVNWITASLQANERRHSEGSILSSYADDDKAFWKQFRRELVREGYSSRVLRRHKDIIRQYVKELGDRGLLDELPGMEEHPDRDGEVGQAPDANFEEASNSSQDEEAEEQEQEHNTSLPTDCISEPLTDEQLASKFDDELYVTDHGDQDLDETLLDAEESSRFIDVQRSAGRKQVYDRKARVVDGGEDSEPRSQAKRDSRTKKQEPPLKRTGFLGGLFLTPAARLRANPASAKLVTCMICLAEDVAHAKAAKLQCGHRMCNTCLKRFFVLSTRDLEHMPPRCCGTHIPLRHVAKMFDLEFKKLWNRRFRELHYSTCGKLICYARQGCDPDTFSYPKNVYERGDKTYVICGGCEKEFSWREKFPRRVEGKTTAVAD
ncbi:IBR domain-containing protein [Phlyctema vagabunda]|uniref:IBR domain-containing protein n=1 Tax=Phlyctema vagabunda TaxID=108571 RepID=A0ABR4PDH3_9HELO